MTSGEIRAAGSQMPGILRKFDPAVATAFGSIVILLALASLYSSEFLSVDYLLQQLKIASFLGVIATGMMIIILLGQIDLSVPWVVAVGGMMASAATAYGVVGETLAIPFGIACGIGLGLVNGIGVAYLRIPSMIVTLAVNAVAKGLMVAYTGGFSPQDSASEAMRFLGAGAFNLPVGTKVLPIPVALIVWAVIGAVTVFVLSRTTFGRAVYAIGNRERAAYLSGIATQRVVLVAFAAAGALSAFGGVLLAGYASHASQAMGDPYLLPSIAAVVLGGTSILGGRGSYFGTVAGVIFITLLASILSVVQPQQILLQIGIEVPAEAVRQVIYGVVIIVMLLLYGREKLVR